LAPQGSYKARELLLKNLSAATLETMALLSSERHSSIGDDLLYAFTLDGRDMLIGNRSTLGEQLTKQSDRLRAYPFLYLEYLRFVQDDSAKSKAGYEAAYRQLASVDEDIARQWKRYENIGHDRKYQQILESPPSLLFSLLSQTQFYSGVVERTAIQVVPKGLRSFDEDDADFFLELLPGPRDRDGLPDSIRFWKRKIEQIDPDLTFRLGLIYGPSGCGKSSLVKAGLLPRLAKHVLSVYVEASPEETETRLLKALREACPDLPPELGLVDALALVRKGRVLRSGQKVLIVLDQFEQWLHAKRSEENTELIAALRHCDGEHLQAVVLVRDDFWMAATRFMRDLEIRLLEGENSAAVDLFDLDHARKVLVAFGRAFGRLPEHASDTLKDQKDFLKESVNGLAEEGKVISVRLALFAEMMKGKPWTPSTLKEVGGTKGVGVTFLEETFSASTAPPEHRFHQKAAQAVLKALLPESGTDIKGQMRSRQELLDASGYANRPRDFDDLIRILDPELRLITPTDPEGPSSEGQQTTPCGQYYQLTHDYLVPIVREWLTRNQKETRRGRAELLLTEMTHSWKNRNPLRFEIAHLAQPNEMVELLTQIDPSSLAGDELSFIIKSVRKNYFSRFW